MALALVSFALKKCEDRGRNQREYPRPEFLDISPKPINSSSQRILKVHVHNHFQEFILSKKKDAISRNILTVCRSMIRLHILCSQMLIYTGHKSNLITAKHCKGLESYGCFLA